MQLRTTVKFISATILSSVIAVALGVGPLYAAQDAIEVAIVENVSGQVVAFLAANRPYSKCSMWSAMGHDWTSRRIANCVSATTRLASF
jgi:hypothetical protein